jgi:hypothetical protein
MKMKILLLVITLAVGAVIILAAQFLPEYKDVLFTSLLLLAILFSLVLLVLNSRKKHGVEGAAARQEHENGQTEE